MGPHQLVDYAASLFAVVGTSRLFSGDTLLILGLESTSQRNLDEFGRSDGEFQLYGFEKHIDHRLQSIVSYIRHSGFSAEPVGWLGYPPRGELNLKDEAIRAGLGRRGKSTVVLHPKYGPRLRFTAIRTDYPMEAPPRLSLTEEENPTCSECSICIDACPAKALEPYHMPDPSLCLSNSARMIEEQGRLMPCDICLSLCPTAKGK